MTDIFNLLATYPQSIILLTMTIDFDADDCDIFLLWADDGTACCRVVLLMYRVPLSRRAA